MSWTIPRTWVTNELVTADMLNEQLRDNLVALKSPAFAAQGLDRNWSTTATSWVEVDAPNLRLTLQTQGGNVLVGWAATLSISTSSYHYYLGVKMDTGSTMYVAQANLANYHPSGGAVWLRNVPAGTHTFYLMAYVTAGTFLLVAGRGQFWAQEVS